MLATALAAGCTARSSSISQCVYNTDCPGAQSCLAGSCRAPCRGDRDCPSGNRCVLSTDPQANACVPSCTSSQQCDPNSTCFRGLCTAGCQTDGDCVIRGLQGTCDLASRACILILVQEPDAGPVEASVEASVDSSPDVPLDVAPEASPDAALDASPESAPEASLDAVPEGSLDASADAALDAASESPLDGTTDVVSEGPRDAALEGSVDAAVDAGMDGDSGVQTVAFALAGATVSRGSTAAAVGHPCPPGQAVTGLFAAPFAGFWNGNLTALQLYCGVVTSPLGSTVVNVTAGDTLPSPTGYFTSVNTPSATTGRALRCPANQVLVGFGGASGSYVSQLTLRCAPLLRAGSTLTVGAVTMGGTVGATVTVGSYQTVAFPATDCPANQVGMGYSGATGSILDSFGLQCATLALAP